MRHFARTPYYTGPDDPELPGNLVSRGQVERMQESAESRNTDHECTDAPALGPDVARVPYETLLAGVRAEAELSADNAGEQLVQRPVHVGDVPTTQTVLEGLVRALEQLSNRLSLIHI